MQFTRIKVDKGQVVLRETPLKTNKTMREFAYWVTGYLSESLGISK
jgi:hypothetical protein